MKSLLRNAVIVVIICWLAGRIRIPASVLNKFIDSVESVADRLQARFPKWLNDKIDSFFGPTTSHRHTKEKN